MVNRRIYLILLYTVFVLIVIALLYIETLTSSIKLASPKDMGKLNFDECDRENFDNFDNVSGTKTGCYLVPNIVHFIKFGGRQVNFVEAVCILAALKNQNPDYIYIHTDLQGVFQGKYWAVLLDTPGFREKLVIKFVTLPTEIYGQPLSVGWRKFHGGDVMRLRILMQYGGIYLDNDSFIVRNLNDLRRYEMSLGWMENCNLANQVILANKNARFLKKWLETYKQYDKNSWYYNAGEKPTKEVLEKHPELIHREKILLANHLITGKIFWSNWTEWRTHYAFHLLINHQYTFKSIPVAKYPVVFDENNIKQYLVTFREMVYDVYPNYVKAPGD